ncbi:hypothetical protein PLICRDRAFT_617662 [Plicaturopsis crispa FD-325 SS-3]|nr:hypothetical protein PLICRDRAFT_617662 [Plicaturopsis crispa FD-325 SS-3]
MSADDDDDGVHCQIARGQWSCSCTSPCHFRESGLLEIGRTNRYGRVNLRPTAHGTVNSKARHPPHTLTVTCMTPRQGYRLWIDHEGAVIPQRMEIAGVQALASELSMCSRSTTYHFDLLHTISISRIPLRSQNVYYMLHFSGRSRIRTAS